MKAGTFAPYLATLRDLIQALYKCRVGLLKCFLCAAPSMLQLYQCRPKSPSGIVDLERTLDHIFCLCEEPVSYLKHDCLKVDLPLRFDKSLGL